MSHSVDYGDILDSNKLKKLIKKDIFTPITVSNDNKKIFLFSDKYVYTDINKRRIPKDIKCDFEFTNNDNIDLIEELIGFDDTKVIVLQAIQENKFLYIGEVYINSSERIYYENCRKLCINFSVKNNYSSFKLGLGRILYNKLFNIGKINLGSKIDIKDVQNIVLEILDEYEEFSGYFYNIVRKKYLKRYIRKLKYYTDIEKPSFYSVVQNILSDKFKFEFSMNNKDCPSAKSEHYYRSYKNFTDNNEIYFNKQHILWSFLYVDRDMLSLYRNVVNGKGYKNFEECLKRFHEYIKDFFDKLKDNKETFGKYNANYNLEYEYLEMLCSMYRFNFTANLIVKNKIPRSTRIINDLVCMIKMTDIDYSVCLIKYYLKNLHKGEEDRIVKEAIIYSEFICPLAREIITLLLEWNFEIYDKGNKYITIFKYGTSLDNTEDEGVLKKLYKDIFSRMEVISDSRQEYMNEHKCNIFDLFAFREQLYVIPLIDDIYKEIYK